MGRVQTKQIIFVLSLIICISSCTGQSRSGSSENMNITRHEVFNPNRPNEAPEFEFVAVQWTTSLQKPYTIMGSTRNGNKTLQDDFNGNKAVQTVRSFRDATNFTTILRIETKTKESPTITVDIMTIVYVTRYLKDGSSYAYELQYKGVIKTVEKQEGVCKKVDDPCGSLGDCCGSLDCLGGKCRDPSPTPPPGSGPGSGLVPGSGLDPRPNPNVCRQLGSYCSSASDCCGTSDCIYGQCKPPKPPCKALEGQCSSSEDCCGTSDCFDGKCKSPCKALGGHCSSTKDCCEKSDCVYGQCTKSKPPCKELGNSCSSSGDCCGSSDCVSGQCTDESHKPGDAFKIRWAVKDEQSRNDFNQDTDSDGEIVKGIYRTLLPDGRTQVVTYTADWKNGYVAKVDYE